MPKQAQDKRPRSVARKSGVLSKSQGVDRGQYYHCTECDYKTLRRKTLNEHRRLKHNPRRIVRTYTCDVEGCTYKSIHKYLMNRHNADRHNIGVKWYRCTLCPHKSKQNSQLKQHMADIHDIQVQWHICPYPMCKYKAKQVSSLNSHVLYNHVHGSLSMSLSEMRPYDSNSTSSPRNAEKDA